MRLRHASAFALIGLGACIVFGEQGETSLPPAPPADGGAGSDADGGAGSDADGEDGSSSDGGPCVLQGTTCTVGVTSCCAPSTCGRKSKIAFACCLPSGAACSSAADCCQGGVQSVTDCVADGGGKTCSTTAL